jgi:4'-phosphopantetheinyl transferase
VLFGGLTVPRFRVYCWDERDSAVDALNRTGLAVVVFDVRGVLVSAVFPLATFTALELERAQRFRLEVNRNEYLAARGMIRSLLAPQVGLLPNAIVFEGGRHEKPQLLNPECAGIDVSLSHSAGRVACAFMRGGNIGVDIESLAQRAGLDMNTLARRVLSPAELDAWEMAPKDGQKLLRVWTRKEAVLKAAAVGLSVEPGTFDVLRPSAIRFAGRLWTCHSQSLEPDIELSVAWSTK